MIVALCICMCIVSMMYASVGHGGASGYIAVMGLLNYPSLLIRQDALLLNIVVSAIAFFHFYRNGFFQWKKFLPLVITSIPMAFLGGYIQIPGSLYKMVLGILLLAAAVIMLFPVVKEVTKMNGLSVPASLGLGACLGMLSGMTGIGGGVFLSPILILGGWENQKTTAALAAPFILVNSISGLSGTLIHQQTLDHNITFFAIAVLLGGFLGAYFGAGKFSVGILRKILGVVLLVASFKLIFI